MTYHFPKDWRVKFGLSDLNGLLKLSEGRTCSVQSYKKNGFLKIEFHIDFKLIEYMYYSPIVKL